MTSDYYYVCPSVYIYISYKSVAIKLWVVIKFFVLYIKKKFFLVDQCDQWSFKIIVYIIRYSKHTYFNLIRAIEFMYTSVKWER